MVNAKHDETCVSRKLRSSLNIFEYCRPGTLPLKSFSILQGIARLEMSGFKAIEIAIAE